jgi:hypothetical protein
MIPGQAGGRVTGAANKGLPVLGGQMGLNQFSPTSGIPNTGPVQGPNQGSSAPITSPVASAGTTGKAPSTAGGGAIIGGGAMAGAPPTAIATPPAAVTSTAAATPAGAGGGNATLAGYTPQQTQALQKQLNDIYGKGEGGLMFQMISNLGSNDSSYMQAYNTAMSKQIAEGSATLQTAQGNAGISANSSAAAIESADYMSGIEAQAGLQEQQLIQQQQQEAIGLTQGLQSDAKAENSTSWLNTLAQVASIGATFAGEAGGPQAMASLFKSSPSNIPNINAGTSSTPQLPGVFSGASAGGGGYTGMMPLSIG